MPRNLIVYGLAVLGGLVVYGVLRSVLGADIVTIISLIAIVIVGVVIFRNLRTNRKVAEATPQQRSEALALTPVADRGALYVFRNQFVGKAVGINVLIDGREVAQLKSPRFTRILLTPGAHRIAGYTGTNKKPGDAETGALNVAAGEILVLKCEVEPQMVGVTIKFTPTPPDVAQRELNKITRMILPDVNEI